MPSDLERFMEKVSPEPNTGCWLWAGAISSTGYGSFTARGASVSSHRFAYPELRGQIPEGLDLDHLCRNRWCCNPTHLEPVTRKTNIGRGLAKGGTWNRGERSRRSKLTEAKVAEIRTLYARGGVRQEDLAARFGVMRATISAIVRRKLWAHVPALQTVT